MGGGEGERRDRTVLEGGRAKGERLAGSMERTREKTCWRMPIQSHGLSDVSHVSGVAFLQAHQAESDGPEPSVVRSDSGRIPTDVDTTGSSSFHRL